MKAQSSSGLPLLNGLGSLIARCRFQGWGKLFLANTKSVVHNSKLDISFWDSKGSSSESDKKSSKWLLPSSVPFAIITLACVKKAAWSVLSQQLLSYVWSCIHTR